MSQTIMRADLTRKLLDLSLQSGRLYQSKKTGFVHDSPEIISIFSNFLFALALLRQKTQECVLEAKQLLDRLLFFQQMDEMRPSFGNFPVFLHDYPYCRDHYVAARLLAPLYWIQKEFSHVLGQELGQRLTQATVRLQAFLKQLSERSQLPSWDTLRLFPDSVVPIDFSAQTPEILSQLITSCCMRPQNKLEDGLKEYLQTVWLSQSALFIGPKMQPQLHYLPQVTLFDYYLSYLAGTY